MKLAPIVLFCFKRIDTLQLCIHSLQQCPESKDTDLIIFSDTSTDDKTLVLVEKVRDYVKHIDGFKSVTRIYRPQNFGVDNNIIEGIKYMSETYHSFIVVEDDLIVSTSFLNYMNHALIYFERNQNIITISGTNFLKKIPKKYIYDFFIAGISNPWGWATWSNKIKNVDWNLASKEGALKVKVLREEFNWWASDRYRMLHRTIKGEIKAWDIRLDYYMFRFNLSTVYCMYNLVKNIGFNRFDASNTVGYNRYKKELDSRIPQNFRFTLQNIYNKDIISEFKKANSISARIVTKLFKFIGYKNQY